jgi:pimeloyl-ACP methyl ester carboxylesterase/DNA-binding CsgD family transcriptional regulator
MATRSLPPTSSAADPLLSDAPDALIDALARWTGSEHGVSAITGGAPSPAAVLNEALAVGGLAADGRWIDADPLLARCEALADALAHGELVQLGDHPALSFIAQDHGPPLVVLTVPRQQASHWPPAADWQRRQTAASATHVVMVHRAMLPGSDGLIRAGRMLALTPRENRLLAALARTGDLRDAAASEAITYETARGAIKAALAKSGFARQGALVATALQLDAIDDPQPLELGDHLQQAIGLSDRQVALARLIALGSTRDEAARQLGLGCETAKAELKILFQLVGVQSAVGLSIVAAQLGIAGRLLAASDIGATDLSAASEPLRFIQRRDRAGRVAFADYGPRDHIPAIHFHTATTSRYVPRSYVARLQELGLRPVMIDRPGYGLTDMVEGDYLDHEIRDVLDVVDSLHADRFHIIARGGTILFAHLAAHYRQRIARAVVLNPEPPPAADARMAGLAGRYKRIFYYVPRLVRPLTRYLASHLSDGIIERIALRFFGASAADQRLFADPDIRRAYVYATRLAAIQGGVGLEAVGEVEPRSEPPPLSDGSFITILSGEEDALYRPEDAWPRLLAAWPGAAAHRIAGAGRLLHLQHPELIAAALDEGSQISRKPRQSAR